MSNDRRIKQLLCVLLLVCLTACTEAPRFNATDLAGADFGKDFALTDHTGKPKRLADFSGRVVILFFGYTQCPDVCPTNMGTFASAMKALGPDADKVQIVFVTLDPERDTQELLAQYVPAFHPSFIGLRGDAAATAETAKSFKVFYQKQPGKTATSYTVDHTAGSYMFDPKGKLRLYVHHGSAADKIAQDIRTLLAGK
jgi:protein SCO1/2